MKKIKKFNLNQNHFLSTDEMTKLTGGEYLYDLCNKESEGKSCLYGGPGSHFTGTCRYIHYHSSTDSNSITITGYFCIKN